MSNLRKNKEIKISPVRVIDENGAQLGIIPTFQALNLAISKSLDLVEVSPQAKPPVCKIMDFGKYNYQLQKTAKAPKAAETKEIQLRPNIAENDLNVKIAKIKEFLAEGHRVVVALRFKGREMAHTSLGFDVVNAVVAALQGVGKAESKPSLDGNTIRVLFVAQK